MAALCRASERLYVLRPFVVHRVIHLWAAEDVPVVQGESYSRSTKAPYAQPFSGVIDVFGQWV